MLPEEVHPPAVQEHRREHGAPRQIGGHHAVLAHEERELAIAECLLEEEGEAHSDR